MARAICFINGISTCSLACSREAKFISSVVWEAIIIPSEISQKEYENSRNITNVTIIKIQPLKSQIKTMKRNTQQKLLDEIN